MAKRKDKSGQAPTIRCPDCGAEVTSKYALKLHREFKCEGAEK
jgi:hypothetical protein